MLHFSKFKALAIVFITFATMAIALPNFLTESQFRQLPSWAQRHIVLGLDLQGGVHLLVEVDSNAVKRAKVETLRDDIRRELRTLRVRFTGLGIQGDTVSVRLSEGQDTTAALTRLRELSQPVGGIFSGQGARTFDIREEAGGLIRFTATEAGINDHVSRAVAQSIAVIERRLNALGTVEPLIQRQGRDRVLVQVPGERDPDRVKRVIGTVAKMSFHLVADNVTQEQIRTGAIPAGTAVYQEADRNGQPDPGGTSYVIQQEVAVSGEDLVDANANFDSRTSEPIVNFRFNANGARRFCEVSTQNVNRPFAILLDRAVISAPVIREPICQGSGQISGNFSVESANELALLLRAGALPAPLSFVEERTVGPGLGADSIRAGTVAAYIGTGLVIAFMLASYGLFGVFAVIALAVNLGMIFGLMSLLGATLTLPGIAGLVLTAGMAVDSNVLIYERIREESRAGRNAILAIDAGFSRAIGTILDANITTLIAALILFYLGAGPVRGFAVTLALGIVTTVFTAVTFTRLMVAVWVRQARPKTVPI